MNKSRSIMVTAARAAPAKRMTRAMPIPFITPPFAFICLAIIAARPAATMPAVMTSMISFIRSESGLSVGLAGGTGGLILLPGDDALGVLPASAKPPAGPESPPPPMAAAPAPLASKAPLAA